jgi:gluconokinase
MRCLTRALAIIVMGVTGSGKTRVGTRLAARLGFSFYDADHYHDPANIEKMRRGEPICVDASRPVDDIVECIAAQLQGEA